MVYLLASRLSVRVAELKGIIEGRDEISGCLSRSNSQPTLSNLRVSAWQLAQKAHVPRATLAKSSL